MRQRAHITKQFQEEFSLFLCVSYPETQFKQDIVQNSVSQKSKDT